MDVKYFHYFSSFIRKTISSDECCFLSSLLEIVKIYLPKLSFKFLKKNSNKFDKRRDNENTLYPYFLFGLSLENIVTSNRTDHLKC